jgi:hypothetical protein
MATNGFKNARIYIHNNFDGEKLKEELDRINYLEKYTDDFKEKIIILHKKQSNIIKKIKNVLNIN